MFTALSITSLSQGNLNPMHQIARSSLDADFAQATADAPDQPTVETSGRSIDWLKRTVQLLGKFMQTNPSLTASNQAQ